MFSSITEGQDKSPNKRRTLADLRGSGDLAFHADVSALIIRERGDDGASIDRRAEIVVAKQRDGRVGVVRAAYNTLLFEERWSLRLAWVSTNRMGFAFAYIDGSHAYDFVRHDFENTDRHLDVGGYILFDDSSDQALFGLTRLMKEIETSGHYELV